MVRRFLIFAFFLLPVACSVKPRVDSTRAEITARYESLKDWEELPCLSLSWEQAIELLEQNNLELRRARHSVEEARIMRNKVYTEFIPLVDIGNFYNKALIQGDSNYPDSNYFNLNIIFNIPALTQLPVNHYTRSLALFKAEHDVELKRRELVAKLWQLFRQYDIEQRSRVCEDARLPANEPVPAEILKTRELQTKKQELELATLLNDYSVRRKPNASSLPSPDWGAFKMKAKRPDPCTQISMALTLEVARLQKLGVAMRYLPDVNINFYSPSLFTSTGGTTSGFMSGEKDVRLNLNIYMQLDTRLDIWTDWLIAKENYALTRLELTQKMHQHRNQMQLLLDSWKSYDEWKCSTQAYVDFRRRQGALNAKALADLFQEDAALQKEMLEQEAKNLERECALIQEYGLPGMIPHPPHLP